MTATNFFNHPNWANPSTDITDTTGAGGDHERWRDYQRVGRRPRWFAELPYGAAAAVLKYSPERPLVQRNQRREYPKGEVFRCAFRGMKLKKSAIGEQPVCVFRLLTNGQNSSVLYL